MPADRNLVHVALTFPLAVLHVSCIGFRLIGYEEHGLSIGGAVMCKRMNPDEVATTDLSALLIA